MASSVVLALDLIGTFAFAIGGTQTASTTRAAAVIGRD